jgi:1-phosphofructokinase
MLRRALGRRAARTTLGSARLKQRMTGRVAVFAPSPLLTITIERATDHKEEVHLHAGGQGFWVARLAATLGADVVLCCALGGEPGRMLRGLIDAESLMLRAVTTPTANGVYIHDRRSGTRVEVVRVESEPLARHATDELYGIALGAGLDADLMLMTGSEPENIVDADVYRRLAGDLGASGKVAIADLTGSLLRAALEGGIELLRISHEELVRDGYAASDALPDLVEGANRLHAAGARHVLVSRGAAPALVVGADGDSAELAGPVFESLDERGAGDSMFAAIGVGLARGMGLPDALRLGAAAGALNATRRGLGTGTQQEIERLAVYVTIRPLSAIVDNDATPVPD